MWPNAKIGVMGADQLSAVMEAVGRKADPELKARIDRESGATFSSARLWDDGIIAPAQTRGVLGRAIEICLRDKPIRRLSSFGVFRM